MSGSPLSLEGVVDCGGDTEIADGDVERVEGGFTATESFVATVDSEAFEPVRRANAARRGRGAEVVAVDELAAPPFVAFMLIRAAS